jgi:hypothetical protein
MELKPRILGQEITKAKGSSIIFKKIPAYAPKVMAFLRYMEMQQAGFSRATAANEILEEVLATNYPELWAVVNRELPRIRDTGESNWAHVPTRVDGAIRAKAWAEVNKQGGELLTVYNPRAATIMRYFKATIPRFSTSGEITKMLEQYLSRQYPALWNEITTR